MKKSGVLAAAFAACVLAAAPGASWAQSGAGIPARPGGAGVPAAPILALSLGRCVQGSAQLGVARFRNVGRHDRNEGAPNVIVISLCSAQADLGLTITDAYCEGRLLSKKRFQNVGNTDFNEGAPNFVTISLCARGPIPGNFRLARHRCSEGFGEISAVRFQNVGNKDFNEGAPNFITIRLCASG